MSHFRAFLLIAVVAATGSTAYADTPRLHLTYTAAPAAVGLKDAFGYRLSGADKEGNFVEQYQRIFIKPRALPKTRIHTEGRRRAWLELRETRLRLKMPHINSGYSSGPVKSGGV